MPNNSTILIALLVLVVIVAFLVPMSKTKEQFASNSGIDEYDSLVGSRGTYIDQSKQKYNKFSDSMDVTRGNLARSDDPAVLKSFTYDIQSAMKTSELTANPGEPTYLGVKKDIITAQMPPSNGVLSAAKKCEALRSRGSCAKLDDPAYANCGVCIKGGSPYSYENPGKHIGGLLVLPDDRAFAEETAKENRTAPVYEASVGGCPPGHLYVKRAACEKAVNRADCKEVGETGGFNGGKTDEGISAALAKCAQAPAAGESSYVYEPKGDNARKFKVNLRVLSPIGTGVTKVFVKDAKGAQVAAGISKVAGQDFIVNIPSTSELTQYTVVVEQEVPHRKGGKQEVFQFVRNLVQASWPNYNQVADSSRMACEAIGARIATDADLQASFLKGNQACSCANTAESNGYPMQAGFEKRGWCGNANTINKCHRAPAETGWNGGMGHSWCYGVKPPQTNGNAITMFNVTLPFFGTLGNLSEPSQEDMPTQWSEYGDYQAAYRRAVILQWEIADGSGTRVIPFEPTIVGLNGMGPSTVSSDGTKTFKILRRMGTYAKSTLISAPRPNSSSSVLTNQFWIWSNLANSQSVSFDVKVPGIFLNTFYPEDAAVAGKGPLIGNPDTMQLLRTSPCLKEGQAAGKYNIDCLANLFVGSGGDIYRGKLAKENGGLSQLNKMGDMDAISEYLGNLYTLATTGRDATGNKVGGTDSKARKQAINNASQLMFGFDITTPCEDVSEDNAGNIVITPKTGALDADCLDYLWMNTNSDRDRGDEDVSRNTSIKNTYTTIGARFSGLRSTESDAKTREQFPFQTCQRKGSMAPLQPNGNINVAAMNMANSKGSIQAVQNFYNGIHKAANELGGSVANMDAHADAVQKCYGVTKNVDDLSASGCGVVARYVRVLASNVFGGVPGNSCIQIPQIEVFNLRGQEIAKGKPTRAASVWAGDNNSGPEKAVDGKNFLHGHGSEYHDACTDPNNQFWLVDLGKMTEISKIKFYPRTDCCNYRQLGAPVQLLDESQNVVAEKNLGEANWPNAWGAIEELQFSNRDIKPEVDIKIGALVSFTTAIAWDRYLLSSPGAVSASPGDTEQSGNRNKRVYSNDYKQKSTLKIVSPLNGRAGWISLQSTAFPNYYIRHQGFRVWLQNVDGTVDFRESASFKIVPSLNGNPSMVSFQSNNPKYYICTHWNNPEQIWLTTVDTANAWNTQRACWKVRKPMIYM